MNALLEQLVALPIVVPLVAGAAMLLLTEARRAARIALALASSVVQLAVAVVLLYLTSDAAPFIWQDGIGVYQLEREPFYFRGSTMAGLGRYLMFQVVNPTEGVRVMVVPGSQQVKVQAEREGLDKIFKEAGAEWREAGCSMCIAMNGDQLAPGEYAVSTSNRNFEGRQGKGGRTFLASPLTAVATAITGVVTDPREMMEKV